MQDIPVSANDSPVDGFDLVLRGGRLFDPESGLDAPGDLAFRGGRIAAIGARIDAQGARKVVDVRGGIVVPGLVDLHTHVYWGATGLGVNAESLCCRSGTTTFVDAGSAGAGNFAGFRRFVAESTRLNILAFLNVSYAGIFGFGPGLWVGENWDLRLVDRDECARAVEANRDLVVGIKVRIGAEAGGPSGLVPLELALEVAERLRVPIMAHVDMPPPTLAEVLARLRPGDVWTHCYRGPPNAAITETGELEKDVLAARKRGVLLDVGHGFGSFSFGTARRLIAEGVYPDSISSDVHAFSVDGPARDLLHVASKFLNLGVPLADVVRRVSSAPARCIGRPDLGRLAVGGAGDAVVLSEEGGRFEFVDSQGELLVGERRLRADRVVVDGALWEQGQPAPGHPGTGAR
jgi:dihydroorotase